MKGRDHSNVTFAMQPLQSKEHIVPMLNGGEEGTGQCLHEGRSPEWRHWKIPHESRKAHPNSHASHNFFPMNGLAGAVKKNPPRAAKPQVEDFLFTTTAKPWMGKNCDAHRNWDVPWVTNREFSPSQNCQMTSLTFLICKWKLVNIFKTRMMICTKYIVRMTETW